jgi:hypothetical protein
VLRYLGLSLREIGALLDTQVGNGVEPLKVVFARQRALYVDIQNALDRKVSPDSAEGRALVARWMHLCDEFTLGNAEIGEGFRRMYDDESHWPDDEKAAKLRANRPKPEYRSFVHQAVQACLRHG